MSRSISNIDINRIFSCLNNDDINANFVGVFPLDKINKFASFGKMMTGRKYPFLISNTDRSDKKGMHWWNIFDIEPKNEIFLFDSFGVEELKNFIIQDDGKIINKIITGIENIERIDNKLMLVKLKFSIKAFNKFSNEKIKRLSETAQDFFHFIKSFGKFNNLQNYVELWLLKDPIQKTETSACVPFQIYFYDNVFLPDEKNKIQSYKKLRKKTIETLLNEIFTLDREQNERAIREYMKQMNITLT